MTMKPNNFLALYLIALLAGCARPAEVRELASAALPIAANLQTSASALQERFSLQRKELDGRADTWTTLIDSERSRIGLVERDWRFAGSDGLAKQLAILREGDKAIVADPLASLAPSAPTKIKMPTLDKASINNVVGGFDKLRHANPQNIKDLVSFSQSVNSELSKLKDEKSPQPQTTEGE